MMINHESLGKERNKRDGKERMREKTSRPWALCGQRYPLPCFVIVGDGEQGCGRKGGQCPVEQKRTLYPI